MPAIAPAYAPSRSPPWAAKMRTPVGLCAASATVCTVQVERRAGAASVSQNWYTLLALCGSQQQLGALHGQLLKYASLASETANGRATAV